MLVALRRRGIWLIALAVAVTPATTSASSRSSSRDGGTIQFAGDWETGDASQWTWTQCSSIQTAQDRGTLRVVTEPVGQGRFAARFDLPSSDRNNACEVLRRRTLAVGSDDWYGLEVRLPRRWQEPSPAGWGLMIAQLNYQGIWGPPVGLVATAKTVDLVLQSGLCNDVNSPRPGCAFSSGAGGNVRKMVAIRGPVAQARWHQLVVHVRWASDSGGLIEAWHRPHGRAQWTRTVSRSGFPTVQWSAQRPPTYQGTVDKIGAYRGPARFPLTVWHDAFVVGTSFDTVSAQLR